MNDWKRTGWMAGAAVAMLAAVSPAMANTATSNIAVTATVSATCSINAGSLTFGTYDPLASSAVDGSASLAVSCTKGATATITLGQGAHAASGSTDAVPLRQMQDGGTNKLSYSLYTDIGRNTTWGNTGVTGASYTSTSSAAAQVTVYGRIASGQDLPAGSYSDTVVATITF